jgi:hypothetical protein
MSHAGYFSSGYIELETSTKKIKILFSIAYEKLSELI